MKRKYLLLFLVVFVSMLFSGCGCGAATDELTKASKNLNKYEMDIIYDEHKLTATQALTYKNKTSAILNDVKLHLHPKAFAEGAVNKPVSALNEKKAYPNGINYGDIDIKTVKINEGDASFEYLGEDNNILKVNTEAFNPDETIKLIIEYEVTIPNINHRFGYGANTINVANFYPVMAIYENCEFSQNAYHYNGDPFYSDMANYFVNITIPNNLKIANTGEVKEKIENNEKTTYKIEAMAVRDFAFVLSEKFEMLEENIDGTLVKYYYYEDDEPEKSLRAATDALTTFNDIFGKYPYSTLSVAKTNFLHGGMEYPGLVYISDEVSSKNDYYNVIIHEIAHQWWYNLVGSDAFSIGWQDEGLAEYSTVLFYERHPEYGVQPSDIIKNNTNSYVLFVKLYKDLFGNVDTSMNRKLNEYDTEYEYVYIAYVKGMLLFDSLRDLVGEEKFLKSIKTYFEENKFKNVNNAHIINAFEKTCKTDLKNFFDSWIEGKVIIQNV